MSYLSTFLNLIAIFLPYVRVSELNFLFFFFSQLICKRFFPGKSDGDLCTLFSDRTGGLKWIPFG